MTAWATPRTWVSGENPDEVILNSELRDLPLHLWEIFQAGWVRIPVTSGNTPTSQAVTFPHTFPSTPIIVVSAHTGAPGRGVDQVRGVAATGATVTGFDCWVTRGDGSETELTDTGVFWIAAIP